MTERLEQIPQPSPDDLSVAVLLGARLIEVDPSAAPHWTFRFSDGARLGVGASWRVIANGRVAIAAGDHEQHFGHATPIHAGERVRALFNIEPVAASRYAAGIGDLTLDFANGARLEVLIDSSGYEAWSLQRPDGVTVVATGGGEVVAFRPARPTG